MWSIDSVSRKLFITATLTLGLAMPSLAQARMARMPTEDFGLQVRPYVVNWTGDSTGLLGGFTGHRSIKPGDFHGRFTGRQFGRLTWTKWNTTEGRAYGAVWIKPCIPDCAQGTYHPYGATVHVFRSRAGVFTRMTITPKHPTAKGLSHALTLSAFENNGFWSW
jgi:hypothetical protein